MIELSMRHSELLDGEDLRAIADESVALDQVRDAGAVVATSVRRTPDYS